MKSKKLGLLGVCLLVVLSLVCPVNLLADYSPLPSGTTNSLIDACFTNQTTGFVVGGDGTLLRTTNAGSSWTSILTSLSNAFYSVFFINQSTGYVVGSGGVVLKTTNDGVNWTASFPTSPALRSIYFQDQNTGYIVGSFSTCMKTTNGGTNWVYQTIPVNDEMLSRIVFSQGKGFIGVGLGVTPMYTTTDGGNTWVSDKSKFRNGNGDIRISDICFCGNGIGYAVGSDVIAVGSVVRTVIFRTTDNGNTWIELTTSNSNAYLSGLAVAPNHPEIIYAVGSYFNDPTNNNRAIILASTNSGGSLQETPWGVNNTWLNGATTTLSNAYLVGSNGTIVTTTMPIGINPISSEIPKEFSLSQNYPNPFNPTTNINFAVTKTGNVTIKVFDITGREVATLVNEKLNAGTYTVDFNASNLTSGTYFYKMTADNFSQTKKMVLVK